MLEGDENAPLVTLVNGYARTHTDFRILSKRLVSEGYRVLTLDNRGSGMSKAASDFTIPEMALDVIALWDYLDISSSYLLGISMGGIISQYLSAYDSRVEKLILVSTTSSKEHITPDPVAFSEDFDEVYGKMTSYFHPVFVEKNKMLLEAMVKQMVASAKEGEFVTQSIMQRKALNAFDLTSIDYSKIDLQCLILHGDDDHVITVGAAHELNRKIRGSEVKTYKECGHLILAEKPTELYKDVLGFLKH